MLKHLLTWRIHHLLYGLPTCSHVERCQAVCHLHTDCSGPPCPTEPLFPSHTRLPNFQSIRMECFKHSLIDPFNGAHRPEQTHSFMGFQKCKWSIFLTLSQGFLATGLRPGGAITHTELRKVQLTCFLSVDLSRNLSPSSRDSGSEPQHWCNRLRVNGVATGGNRSWSVWKKLMKF